MKTPAYDAAYIPAKIELCLNIIRFVLKHNLEFWRNINTNILQLVVKHPRFMITKQYFYPHKLDLDSFYNADIALQNIAINATINRSLNWPIGLHNTSQ